MKVKNVLKFARITSEGDFMSVDGNLSAKYTRVGGRTLGPGGGTQIAVRW